MTANHHDGGRAVGAATSDLRNPPAIQEAQQGPIAAMRQKGLGPCAPFSLHGDRRVHRYAIGSDRPGVKAGLYIDYDESWKCRHVVFGLFTRGRLHVWCSYGGCGQCKLVRSLGQAQVNHYRRRLSRLEVCR